MPSRDVNAATRLAEASWRREKMLKLHRQQSVTPKIKCGSQTECQTDRSSTKCSLTGD